MDMIAAYREAGTYRGAASIAGTTHKTVKRVVERDYGRRRRVGPAPRGVTTTAWPSWSRSG